MKRRVTKMMLPMIVYVISLFIYAPVAADEGMWTFDNLPLKLLKEKYGFEPTQEWLDNVRLSSVRFNDGGSGSFVSPNGLVLTNHHVARGQLLKMSSQKKDYVKDGFFAKAQAEEIKSTDLELNVLMSMENVTARVLAAAKKGMNDKEALDAKEAEIAKIEKESSETTGLRSDVVSFYQGGEYWVYRYKKYTDVRIVFAPEVQIAFYGGDPDNFTFPRYDLDMAIFRVYENDKPINSSHYLKWNVQGAAENELVFVSGHPGSTNRMQTMSQIEQERDYSYPYRLKTYRRQLDVLKKYAALGSEQARQAQGRIFGIENALKALTGEYNGLLDKNIMAKKQKDENDFRALITSKGEWKTAYAEAWDDIAKSEKNYIAIAKQLRFRALRGSRMAANAKNIVTYVTEVKKPDADRMDGYHDSQLEEVKFYLFSPAPVYPLLEEKMLTELLQESLEELGGDDPFIKAVLNGRAPADVAKELITNTRMGDVTFRKSLVDGGENAVKNSTDPLIALSRELDPMDRDLKKLQEYSVKSIQTAAGEKIGKARFEVYGKSVNPDATFTLRLSYGTVKGYAMNGTKAPYKTTLFGMYDRYYSFDKKMPFELPARYLERKDKLDLTTPVDFVSTCDIIGGNSGSPVINKSGELVGLIFDGNIESLVGRFVYYDESNRAVAVHSAMMIEALRKLYDAGSLADELVGKTIIE